MVRPVAFPIGVAVLQKNRPHLDCAKIPWTNTSRRIRIKHHTSIRFLENFVIESIKIRLRLQAFHFHRINFYILDTCLLEGSEKHFSIELPVLHIFFGIGAEPQSELHPLLTRGID